MNKKDVNDFFLNHFLVFAQNKSNAINNNTFKKDFDILTGINDFFPCVFYILEYQAETFQYVSENAKNILGYSASEIKKMGSHIFHSNLHPTDFPIYQKIIADDLEYYKTTLAEKKLQNSRFSLNYRFKHSNDYFVDILDQFVILETDNNEHPELILGIWTDISRYKNDETMIFSISEFEETQQYNLIFSKVFPEQLKLTSREIEIIKKLKNGASSKEIGDTLRISIHTVNAHRRNILSKYGFKNTSELLTYCVANNLV